MSAEKKRWHPRLWTEMAVVAAVILALTVGAIILTYRTSLECTYQDGLRQQLSDSLELLRREDFSAEAASTVRAEGIRLMLLTDDGEHRVLLEDANGEPLGIGRERNPDRPKRDGRSPAEADAMALAALIENKLGSAEGSFFTTEAEDADDRRGKLDNKSLYLSGREAGRLFCLYLPVESTNTAVSIAIQFATFVGVVAWAVSVILLYFICRRLARSQKNVVRIAGQIAEMDFSQRCPPVLTRELNELSGSINRMADRLEANVEGLRQANEQLQAELAERTRQQQITTDLIANLSHDFKTPIAVISGYAEGLQEGVARTPEQRQTYYSMILQESEHMQELVYKLLAQSRLDSGSIPLEMEDFDLAELLDQSAELFRREIDRLGLVLERDYPHPIPVRTDYESIRQSVDNYLQNAVFHINNGNRIRIRTEAAGDRIRLCVANSSAPIPPEKAERIWDKLYRGDPSRRRHYGEAGLGLSIVKGNMDRLGLAFGHRNLDGMVEFWLEVPGAGDGFPCPADTKETDASGTEGRPLC